MKIIIKLYTSAFCSIIRSEELEIQSLKLTVNQLKEQISNKFHIEKSEQILTMKYDDKKLITLSDPFPLFYFYIHKNSEIFLEHYKKFDKTKEICEKLKNTKNARLKFINKLDIFSENNSKCSSKNSLPIIEESDNEYTNNDTINKNIISQAVNFIIENKLIPFKEFIYINDFIQEDISVLTNKETKWNALHYSCYYGNEEMTEFLLTLYNPSPEIINGTTSDGWTPLHFSCFRGFTNIVKILLYLKEIDLNIKHPIYGTALHIACLKNETQIVSMLVSSKANLFVKDKNNKEAIELTKDENIKKIIKKAMICSPLDEGGFFPLNNATDLSLYVDNFFTPPMPPITIGFVEKRGPFLPIYKNIFIEINPVLGYLKKYKDAADYPESHFELIDLNNVNSCNKEFPNSKDLFYFSVIYSNKEIFRVKNENACQKWIKIINESAIYCKYWNKISTLNDKVKDYLKKLKNHVEIIDTDTGDTLNYEEEKKKKDMELKAQEREKTLKILRESNPEIFDKKAPLKIVVRKERVKIGSIENNKTSFEKKNYTKDNNIITAKLVENENNNINKNSFDIIEIIFSGIYGKSYKVKLKNSDDSDKFYIMKEINKNYLERKKILTHVINEINLIKRIDHPFILKFHYIFQSPENLYTIEDFCPGDSLKFHISLNLFEEEEAKFYISELILAIDYLHKKNITYINLKPENILINSNNQIQLIGYGLFNNNLYPEQIYNDDETLKLFYGLNYNYYSPEIIERIGKGKAADIYGIGAVLYEMVCGAFPFYSNDINTLYNNIHNSKLMLYEYFSDELKNLLWKLLCKEPKKRIGVNDMNEIKKHKFFKGVDWNKLIKDNKNLSPINLVKNKMDYKSNFTYLNSSENKNNIRKTEYFLGFEVTKQVNEFKFIRKYVDNVDDEREDRNNNENKIDIDDNYIIKGDENEEDNEEINRVENKISEETH